MYVQVAAAARERADIAEQRLAQRQELAQHRDQHALEMLQVRDMLSTNLTLKMTALPGTVVGHV